MFRSVKEFEVVNEKNEVIGVVRSRSISEAFDKIRQNRKSKNCSIKYIGEITGTSYKDDINYILRNQKEKQLEYASY